MKPHISIITLGVNDLQKSTEFYQQLGFPAEMMGNITFIKMPNVWLSLYPLADLAKDVGISAERRGFSGITLAHNVLSESQVDAVFQQLQELDVKIVDAPHKREWGGYSGYFQDLDGYLWEVAYNPFDPEIAVDEDSSSVKK